MREVLKLARISRCDWIPHALDKSYVDGYGFVGLLYGEISLLF